MPTIADLQIKIGADVNAAINGLSKAEFAANKVAEAYASATEGTIQGGFAIAGWAQNFSTAIGAVQRDLERIDLSKLDDDQKESTSNMLALASGALRVSESVTVAGSAFSGMQAIAGPAIAGIARLIPSIGASLVALAGPISLAVGALAAGAALIVSNWDLVSDALSDADKITIEANNSIVEQDSKMRKLVATINDNTRSYKERSSALQEAQSISPTYFGKLDLEKSKVEDVNKAYGSYVDNLKKASLARVLSAELDKEQLKLIELEKKFNERLKKGPGLQLFLPGNIAPINTNDLVVGSFEGLNNDVKSTAKNIDDLTKRLNGLDFTVETKPDAKLDTSKGKAIETEAQKIQGVLTELERKLQLIQIQFKNGLIPDDFTAQVDAVHSAISQIGNVNPNSQAFQQLVNDYKDFANQNPVSIPIIPFLSKNITSVDSLSDSLAGINKKLPKIKLTIDDPVAQVKDGLDKIKNTVQAGVTAANAIMDTIGTFEQASLDARNSALDAYYEKQKAYIEKTTADEGIKNKRLEELEKDVAAKRLAIKRQEAAANKRNAIFNSLINTAVAVTQNLGNPALAVLVGALGAAQTAAIAATPLPALAKGGVATGRNTVIVGEYPGADNNPELILPADKAKKYIVEAVTSTGASGGGFAQQLYSYVSGDDLMLISERGAYRKTRLG